MLVFLSDLHFDDGTAGQHTLSHEAFSVFFARLQSLCERRRPADLRIVLLGDVFDVLRTSYWVETSPDGRDLVPPAERPWGDGDEALVHGRVGRVLEAITRANAASLDAFRRGAADLGAKVVYVPGNHDRPLNGAGALRRAVRVALGIRADPGREEDRFDNSFQDPEHGVFALHGHEFDPYNFESPGTLSPDAYDLVPIGDPVTTELISRLPALVRHHARRVVADEAELEALERNFQQVEDVRPLKAALEWLLHAVRRATGLEDAVEAALDEAIRSFNALPFVKSWYAAHDRDWRWDEADALQAALWAAEKLDVVSSSCLARVAESAATRLAETDDNVAAAEKRFGHLPAELRYVVMGHTHVPKQVAIHADPARPARVYVNTGTWRPTHHRCRAGGFASWKEMSYAVFYRGGERDDRAAPTFETWSGTLEG